MAKWGEGDPRWIVEERADAKNVNNWHWTEKNATQWSIDKIRSLLAGVVIDNEEFFCEITEVPKIEGEAVANNRKAKLIFFYEWQIEADWKGHMKRGDNKTVFKGKLEVTNLSEENEVDELEILASCTTSTTDDAHKIREFVRLSGAKVVKAQLAQYIRDLKEAYSRDLILPSKSNNSEGIPPPTTTSTGPLASACLRSGGDNDRTSGGGGKPDTDKQTTGGAASGGVVKVSTKGFRLEEEFFCTPEDLYKVFTEKEFIRAYSRSEAILERDKNARFTLFGGTITGQFVELNPSTGLTMRWRHGSWPPEHYSRVKLEFKLSSGGTTLTLDQSGVPEAQLDSTREGWKKNYFEPIKLTFGYGGRLF